MELLYVRLLFQADQICYSVLCVFSYVAAGVDRSNQKRKQSALSQSPGTSCLKPVSSQELSTPQSPSPCIVPPPFSPEPGSVTPIGGPPKYPPPALPPGVAPPAPPPGIKAIPAQLSSTVSPHVTPPPIPNRTIPPRQISISQPPQPPPRPK